MHCIHIEEKENIIKAKHMYTTITSNVILNNGHGLVLQKQTSKQVNSLKRDVSSSYSKNNGEKSSKPMAREVCRRGKIESS